MEDFRKNDGQMHYASEQFVKLTKEFIEDDMSELVSYYETKHGVKNGDALLSDFTEILRKWVDRVKEADSSEELSEIYWEEIFSKVDVSKYGL